MKQIIVATDFSSAAFNAAKYAVEMAVAIKADILLLHVYQIQVGYSEVPMAVSLEDMRKEAEQEMEILRNQLLEKRNGILNIESELVQGTFYYELQSVCEKVKPYAVVMGSQGKSATERILFGGHTVYAMKHLDWPLITVPKGIVFSTVRKIGLACDFNKVVDTTPVEEIKKLVNDFNAELHVLNTGKKDEFDSNVVFESGMLQEMIGSLKPNYHFITNSKVDEGIMDFADSNKIDLLVVLPKRHGLFENLVHKSVTKQLVLHSHVPVMALH